MKQLSAEPPLLVKRIYQINLIGLATCALIIPILNLDKLSYEFFLGPYLFLLPTLVFIVSRVFMYKNIYYNDEYLIYESKGREITIPIENVKNITSYFFQCQINYTMNNKRKSLNFVHYDNNLLRVGSFSRAARDIRKIIERNKKT